MSREVDRYGSNPEMLNLLLRYQLQTTSLTRGPGAASTTAIHGRQESDSSNGRHSSSLSKSVAAMPPPILKKSRGPSSTGPRPTARFISPHTSEEEDNTEVSPITDPSAHVIVRPPTPPTPVLQRSKDEKKAETLAGSRRKAHSYVATNATHKRRPGVLRRPNSDPAQESGSNSSNKDICKSLPENANEQPGLGIPQSQLGQASPSPETLLSVNTSRKTRSGKSGHSKTTDRQSLVPKSYLEHDSATSSTLHGLQGQLETGDQPRPTVRKTNYETGVQGSYPEPQLDMGSRSLAASESSSTSRSEKVVQHRPTKQHLPKNLDGKSSICVAPTYTTAKGETDQRDKPRLEVIERQSIASLDRDGESSSRASEQAPLFAKRPVQPAKSASALFSSPTHQSNGSMSRSKSQLTLLLERDRAKEKENKERPDSASKTKDAKSR
jgi:hypothetical protein